MKWVVFFLAAVAVYPAARMIRRYPGAMEWLALALGLLPFVLPDALSINFVSQESYRGDSRGFEVTATDLAAVTAWLVLPRTGWPTPFRLARWVYLGAACLSLLLAPQPLYAAFGLWKILRGYFFFAVIVRLCEQRHLSPRLLEGFALGVVYTLAGALWQRYALGAWRVSADLGHPNTMAMMINLVAPIALAVGLSGQARNKLPWIAVASAAAGVIMSLSRAALALLIGAFGLVYGGSLLRRASPRKVGVALAGTGVAVVMLGMSADTIIERFVTAPDASGETRERFEASARAMLMDHPFGIGINQFSYVQEHGGYGKAVGLTPYERNSVVHHIYWLSAAEMGYLGLLGCVLLFGAPLWRALRGAWRAGDDVRGDVLLGCAAALIAFCLQGFYEWAARQTPLVYMFFAVAALVAVLERQMREDRKRMSER